MVWRGDIQKHYENVDKTFIVMNLIDSNDIVARDALRDVILSELKLSCECIIDWLDDENNENSETASEFIENLDSEYDICTVIDARTFIYDLLGKPLSELLTIGAGE